MKGEDVNDIYRYTLTRSWIGGKGQVCFVMLNPSTADEVEDDPTIRRVVSFAQREGFERLIVVNLFAYRSTDPNKLKALAFDPLKDIIGPDNNRVIQDAVTQSDKVIAAWGTHPAVELSWHWQKHQDWVCTLIHGALKADTKIANIWCLGKTQNGNPRHPLYLKKDAPLELFRQKIFR